MERTPKQLKKVIETVKNQLTPEYEVYLFGSWAKGSATDRSDIDLAVLGPHPVPWRQWVILKQAVDEIPMLRKIDVVDLQRAGAIFRKNILTHAQKM